MSKVLDDINKELDKLHEDLVKNYDKLGLRASGRWANELENFSNESGKGYHFGILGASYTGAIESGRKPNRNQKNIRAFVGWAGSTFLKQWVKDKGLNISPYAVAYKIAREGVKVPNEFNKGGLVSDVITEERLMPFTKIVAIGMLEGLRSDIRNILK